MAFNQKINTENRLLNIVGFQAIWWGIVYFKNLAAIFAILFILIHFYGLKSSRSKEFSFVMAAASLGLLMDGTLSYFGVIDFFVGETPYFLVPAWLVVLWISFCCTLRHSLSWLFNKWYVLVPSGGVGGALTYISAEKLGAIALSLEFLPVLALLTGLWSLLFLVYFPLFHLFKKAS